MTATGSHNKLLNQAARAALRPIGLQQRGRSRTWLDDQGWWIGVVEFQSSAWSKGSYLNVGVTWPAQPDSKPIVFLDLSQRVEAFVEYESPEQFRPEAERLAERAVAEVHALRARLPEPAAAAKLLTDNCRRDEGWACWYAAVMSALAGQMSATDDLLRAVEASDDDRDWWQPVKRQAAEWRRLLQSDPSRLQSALHALITSNREAFGLPGEHPELPGKPG